MFNARTVVLGLFLVAGGCGGGARRGGDEPRDALPVRNDDLSDVKFLMNAIDRDDRQEAERLISKGVSLSTTDERGLPPLLFAAYLGRDEIATLLIDRGADVNTTLPDGTSALMLAAIGNHLAVSTRLIDAGATIDGQTADGVTALMLATIKNHAQMVKLLLSRGANPNATDRYGDTAVVGAAASEKEAVLKVLLTRVDRLEQMDKAITEACLHGSASVVTLMADKGVDIDSRGREGWTCLMLATLKGHINIVNAAVARGADVTAADEGGWSALMTAVAAGDGDIVRMFLEKGADPAREDINGRTALSVAESNGDGAIAELLSRAMGMTPRPLTDSSADHNLSEPLKCPYDVDALSSAGDLVVFTSPVTWHPADAGRLWGRGWRKFSLVRSSKEVPVEVCRPGGEIEYLMKLVCDDGSSPFGDPDHVNASRAGSVGQGGRCGKLVDLYIIHCEEASYKIYMDMYHCTPFD